MIDPAPRVARPSKKRAVRGAGSVFYHAHLDRWACSFSLGTSPDGKRIRRTLYAKTRPELLRLVYDERARNGGEIRARIEGTLGEFVDGWLDEVRHAREAATHISYAGCWAHVEPILGHVKLQDVGIEHAVAMVRRLRNEGVSASMIGRCIRVMHRAVAVAIRQGRYHRANPFAMVEKPKVEPREPRSLSINEARRFIDAARECEHAALWIVLLTGGLRLGEALALRWSDVDLVAGTITVRRSHSEAGGAHVKAPKNRSSRRVVHIGEIAITALRAHGTPKAGLVFCSRNGTPLLRSNVYRQHFRPILQRAEIADLRIHDLRHAHASIGMASGVTPRMMADRLGHSQVRTTLQIYQHVLAGQDSEAARAIDGVLGRLPHPICMSWDTVIGDSDTTGCAKGTVQPLH